MREQILAFAAGLFSLCTVFVVIHALVVGVDFERITTIYRLPLVWALSLGAGVYGLLSLWRAWQYVQIYGSERQSSWSFPRLYRAVAINEVALAAVSLFFSLCNWIQAWWIFALLLLIVGGVKVWGVFVWHYGTPELVDWLSHLRDAETDPQRE